MEDHHHHHHHHDRSRSPCRASPGPHPAHHSRDVSPNWSEVSDHSLPRLIMPLPRRPAPEEGEEEEDEVMHLAKPGGRRSPMRGGRRKGHRAKMEEVGTASSPQLEVLCVVLQLLVACTALLQGIPLALVTAAWQHSGPEVCPLYVSQPPGFGIHWGNEDLAPCKASAFLPLLVAALALTLATAHACVLYVWRVGGHAPAASGSQVYAHVTVVLVVLQEVVATAAAVVLTEGFRQTCISFDLALGWNETPQSCRRRLVDRDDAYQINATFGRLVAGLVGGWTCVAFTAGLLVACAVRARLCRVQLLCI